MEIEFSLTKLIVADVNLLERFYVALGFKVTERRFGKDVTGTGDVAQEQSRLSTTGEKIPPQLVLSRFINFPEPTVPGPAYPGPYWLVFRTPNVAASIEAAVGAGGWVARPAADVTDPRHPFRAGIVCDPEGNFIELYGPKNAAA